MKFVSYDWHGSPHYGVVKNEKVVDLTTRLGGRYPSIVDFIGKGGLPVARSVASREEGDFNYSDLDLLPVVPNPSKIICVGLNYYDHISEANKQLNRADKGFEFPMIFARWPESMTGHSRPIYRPKASHEFDFEAELLVVIGGDTGRYLPEEKALDYVFGYSCFNDGSLRDFQRHSRQINPGKNFEKTGPSGPWLVTADEIPDPDNLEVEMRLNGTTMQKANTKDMIHSVRQIISYVTKWTPFRPGDLIATGTMGGVGFARDPQVFMKPGDVAEVLIEKIGTLRNTVEDERI
jgi:2-keto-4-pentenoate hydratase/2-oxohepta-3-ene-1,7-dioic acid hydratase in catechol pathway